MKSFIAVAGSGQVVFNSKEKAKNYISEHPQYSYKECKVWKYYNPRSTNSTTKYERFEGNDFITAIEQNFDKIASAMGTYGISGRILNKAFIEQNGSIATLTVQYWNCSRALVNFTEDMLSEDKLKVASIQIEDCEEGDVPNGKYEFEMK